MRCEERQAGNVQETTTPRGDHGTCQENCGRVLSHPFGPRGGRVATAQADPVEAFQKLVAGLEYPMFVATTASGGERAGCLVGFTAQCSIDPVRFLTCLSNKNHTFRVAGQATILAIHFLGEGDGALAELFGSNTSDEVDKFARCGWSDGPGGVPILEGCSRGWVAGRIIERMELGDHVGLVLEPVAGEVRSDATPQLGFQDVQHLEPGHEA